MFSKHFLFDTDMIQLHHQSVGESSKAASRIRLKRQICLGSDRFCDLLNRHLVCMEMFFEEAIRQAVDAAVDLFCGPGVFPSALVRRRFSNVSFEASRVKW